MRNLKTNKKNINEAWTSMIQNTTGVKDADKLQVPLLVLELRIDVPWKHVVQVKLVERAVLTAARTYPPPFSRTSCSSTCISPNYATPHR